MTRDARNDPSTAPLAVRLWRSAFPRPLFPDTQRDRNRFVFDTLILHLRPLRVPAGTIRYTHTFGLGGMSLVLLAVLVFTGLLSMMVYEPAPEAAYASVSRLETEFAFGGLVRAVHHWAAQLVLVIAALHLCRVFLTGGNRGPRAFNWLVGLTLLTGLALANFTGYLMPWDQLSYWAVTISTGMLEYVPWLGPALRNILRGGGEVGSDTLMYFYTLHTTVLPAFLGAVAALHFWRVRKAGGVVIPRETDEPEPARPETVPFHPFLLTREVAVGSILVAALVVLGLVFPAPLGDPANPGMSPNPAKAPWYFQGFQELQIHFHPFFAVFLIPLAATLALALAPYLRYEDGPSGRWFLSDRGRATATMSAALAAIITPVAILADEWIPSGVERPVWVPAWLGNGQIPILVGLAAVIGYHLWLRRRLGATRAEAVQALFVFLGVAFVVMTFISVFFRGEGMALAWPWEV